MPRSPKPLPPRPCARCGKAMERRRFGSRLEDVSVFLKRQFCSLRCANTRGNWGQSSTAKRREARKSVKPNCERCGKGGRLHVHHRDENFRNNCLSNLETLCPSCHKQVHVSERQ